MTDEKWDNFMMTGKISDYLDYKKTQQISSKVGETIGNCNPEGNSSQGISGR